MHLGSCLDPIAAESGVFDPLLPNKLNFGIQFKPEIDIF